MEKSNSNDEQLKALEAVKKHLETISHHANIIADELQHLLQPTFPVNKHFIISNGQVLKWLLQPVVPTETKNIDFGAISGYGVEPHTIFSFFCCNTMNPNIQRWARWLLVLLDELEKVNWANETRPSKDHIEAWREATDLMNQDIQRVIKEDFCKFGGQKSHLEEFIDELIAGPKDKRLTQEEFALLDAYLKQPRPSSKLQQENKQKAYSQSNLNQNKLKFIRDYNMQLLTKEWADSTPDIHTETMLSTEKYCFSKNGNIWTIRFDDEHGNFSDLKGFGIIHELIANPQQTFRAMDLLRQDTSKADVEHTRQNAIEPETKKVCKEQLAEYDRDIEKAEKNNDEAKVEELKKKRQQIIDYLNDSLGLGGKSRTLGAGSPDEKACRAVNKNLRTAYGKMENTDKPLNSLVEHLKATIGCETNHFTYRPKSPFSWQLHKNTSKNI